MTTNEEKLRDYLKRATTDLRQARRRITELEGRDHEPIAIIGMACRYPGDVTSPEDLWRLVDDGRDAVTGFPTDRGWDLDALYDPELRTPGTSYVREGGFLHDAAAFDGELFGISPREALAMDPQQRVLLETTWEAVERAAIDAARLKGSDTGVFIGAGHPGYGVTFGQSDLPDGVEGYSMTGKAASVVTGRISYTFGLEGPAVTVDTACSSSLVALHLAVTALRKGECSLAVAGGVTVMPTPELFAEFSRQRGLATDGRCKAFAASADGTGWAEGVGVLLVERLSDARRNGHQVLAVVRGSAVNQDGASNGLTAPNGPSQQRVIRQALANAGLASHQVDAVEAHGTGTTLGDPIEAQALLATYGQGRDSENPLWLGSLKSNIGHAQAAAGVGGVIKMVMAMRNGTLPKTLHIAEPTPRVDWDAGAVTLLTDPRPWPAGDEPRRAGVSSFGVSGTNAHVVIEEAPAETSDDAPAAPDADRDHHTTDTLPWAVSAAGPKALRAQAARLLDHLTEHETPSTEVARALLTTRASLGHRAVIVGTRPDDLLRGLRSLADGTPDARVTQGTAADGTHDPVFVFPGQGAQWSRMGLELADAFPVFDASLRECAAALAPFVGWDLRVELAGGLGRVDVVQPASWAVMVSLARLWESFGVVPAAVVGHSQGEIAAAVVAGALSLEDGARIVAERSRVIGERLAGRGGMASVALPAETVRARIEGFGERLAVAAVNGPSSTVVSGEPAALDELLAALEGEEVRVRRIAVDYASHSSHVESIRGELLDVLAPIVPRSSTVPFYSTVTGGLLDTEQLDAAYWVRNLRQTVEFEATTRALIADGLSAFVECSAHPVLAVGVEESGASTVVGSLRRGDGGAQRFVTSLAQAFTHGLPVDWSTLIGQGPVADLPTYAFQRRSYWLAHRPATATTPRDPAEDHFWDAVEREDLPALATALDLDGDGLRDLLPALAGWRHRSREQAETDSWRYRIAWHPPADPGPARPTGHWIIVSPDAAGPQVWHEAAQRALRDAGARVTLLTPDAATADRHMLAAALRTAAGDGQVSGILSLLALDGRTHPGQTTVTTGYAASLALIQAAADSELGAPLWCATRGAVGTRPDEPPLDAAQAQLWGLGRVVALEQPQLWGGLVDLPEQADSTALRLLATALSGRDGEDQLALRATGLLARRMLRAPLGGTVPPRTWRPEGTVLVTGGTGALGTHIARWLARNGAPHLLLLSRRGPDAPGAAELVAELAESGTRTTIAACDIADRDALEAELARIPGELPLTAVFHTAAVLDDGVVDALDADRVERVLRVKTRGADNLHELTRDRDLTAFVLFSSFAATFGTPGLGNYAPGNVHLEALAEQRRAAGLPATAVAWGTWAGAGMAEGAVGDRARRHGVFALDAEPATRALQQILDHDETCPVVIDMRWDRFAVVFTSERPSHLLDEIPEARRALAEAAPATVAEDEQEPSELVSRLAALPEDDRRRELTDLVRRNAALVLGHDDPASVDESRAFRHLGFDSLTAVELRNRLNSLTGLRLPASLVFDYPTPAGLAAHLYAELLGDAAEPVAAAHQGGAEDDEPIVVVGMACRFPGGVGSPEELWQLVAGEGDAISPLPSGRGWDADALYDPDPAATGKSYVREGGFLHDADRFDPEFFGISPREALAMDPQQRLLLETSWEVLERAGIDPTSLKGTRTGVFAGMTHHNYGATHPALPVPEGLEGYRMTGSTTSVASGRIAYTFGLEGPAVTVDTACSSSLVALHLAVQALRQGECTMALAGGVTVMSSPAAFTEFSRQRGLAPDGRCKAFADAADGFGLAEGIGMLLVERLSDARRNGHRVLAVVRGSAVNQDGASNGLTAPNGPSQQRVIRQALANARLTADDVDAVETHGTGTKLGDPIEAQALMATYGRDRNPAQPLLIGSVKSNIGHTQAAAGVAGVIKMVMAMRHGVLPRTLHVDEPSSHIDWSQGAVSLLTAAEPWPETGHPRRAGVSSFGISGTNVHVLFEQPAPADQAPTAPATDPAGTPHGVVPMTLTAGSEHSLRRLAHRLHAHVENHPDDAPLAIGGALLRSRARLERRAVVVGADRSALLSGLASVAAGEPHAAVVTGTPNGPGKAVFVFPGQGAQWSRMGLELADAFPVFDKTLRECADALAPFVEWDLRVELAGGLGRVDVVQPASWAVMVSLARLWESFGVVPAAVVGHSQGEIAAAVVAGALSLEDGARIVAERSRVIGERLAGRGGMASVALPAETVRARIEGFGERLAVAAVNGPSSTVVSGEPTALDELLAALEGEEVRVRRIAVDYASHSSHVESIREELLDVLAPIVPRSATVPFYSTVTGGLLDTEQLDAAYWVRNLRQTVEFEATTRALIADGLSAFVECSAHPVLAVGVEESGASTVVGSLRREDGGAQRFVTSLAQAFVEGLPVDLGSLVAASGDTVDLPTYPFQRSRFWLESGELPASAGVPRDEVEDRFWEAVEREDLESLADSLDLDGEELRPLLPALASWRRAGRQESVIDSWRYKTAWRPLTDLGDDDGSALSGTWLVVSPAAEREGATTPALVRALEDRGADVRLLEVSAGDADRTALATRISEAADGDVPFSGVVALWGLDDVPHPDFPALTGGSLGSLALLQALHDLGAEAPLWLLTRDAVAVSDTDGLSGAAQAQLWGWGRVAALEHPKLWGGLMDLPAVVDERALRLAVGALAAPSGEDQIAVRAAGVFGRRLVRSALVGRAPGRTWTPRGTVLVTGGSGGIGGHLARWLARGGAEHLVLVSRRGKDAIGAPQLAAVIEELGARVTFAACDIADRDALAALVREVEADGPPVTAVVHAAAHIELGMLADTTPGTLSEICRAKVLGAENLDAIFAERDLDAYVLFSSIAGFWGSGDHGAYAAANAHLDTLAERRRARGLRATSVAWGIWDAANDWDERNTEMRALKNEKSSRHGLPLLDADAAFTALRRIIDHDETVVAVADVDWDRFVALFTMARESALLAEVPEAARALAAPEEEAAPAVGGDLARRLEGLSRPEQDHLLLDMVRAQAAAVLGHGPQAESVDAGRAFREMGFDSLTAVELRNRLAATTGQKLPATLVFDHPSPVELAERLRVLLLPDDASAQPLALVRFGDFETALAAAPPDPATRQQLARRLQGLLWSWSEGDGPAAGAPAAHADDTAPVDVASASADELFDLIDRGLGAS